MNERDITLIRIKDLTSGDDSLDITRTNNDIAVDSVSNGTKKLKLRNIAEKIINYIATHIASILGAPNAAKFLGSDQYGNLVWKDTPAQQNADWNATEGAAKILNKPSLKAVATSGNYNDLSNKPTIPAAQIQADWDQVNTTALDFIKNKPDLKRVATTGSYNDLIDTPTIPDAQIQSDWNQTTTTAKDFIKNKPNLHAVATSGDYTDLSNIPTDLGNFTNAAGYTKSADVEEIVDDILEEDLAAVAFSGSYADLENTPDLSDYATKSGDIAAINAKIAAIGKPLTWIGTLTPAEIEDLEDVVSGSVYTCSEDGTINGMEVTADEEVAWNGTEWFSIGKGNIDLSNYYTKGEVDALIPDEQIQSDWNQTTTTAKDYIKNKPDLFSGSYTDLTDKPTNLSDFNDDVGYLVAADIEGKANTADLADVATSGSYADLSGTPTDVSSFNNDAGYLVAADVAGKANSADLARVATTGSYDDLSDKPTIPTLVQPNWTQTDSEADDYIKNKPDLAAVATSGAYSDLSGKPTIPDAPVQSDWAEADNTKQSFIKNKPTFATVATTGDYGDLDNKPHIPEIGYEEL